MVIFQILDCYSQDLKVLKETEYEKQVEYVLNDDDVRMGCIDVETDKAFSLVNLSVDLLEDYERCLSLLKKINNPIFENITLKQIYENLDGFEKVDDTKEIKLPLGESIKLKEYLKRFDQINYIIRKKIKI
jgi:hypothetical protein